MIINLRTIPHGIKIFEFCRDKDWWHPLEQNDQIFGFDTPLRIKIVISRTGEEYVLDGDLSGGLQVMCDRCLELYHRDLSSVFRAFLALPLRETDKTELELSEEDMEVGFLRGEEIDLDEIIREQIYLSLPMKLLCSENCLGLCPMCGSNLNKKDCQCHRALGHPGFLKLKNLK